MTLAAMSKAEALEALRVGLEGIPILLIAYGDEWAERFATARARVETWVYPDGTETRFTPGEKRALEIVMASSFGSLNRGH